jgi:hypothetical protein
MAWVYYVRLVETKFQAKCLEARLEDSGASSLRITPKYVGIFQTGKGRFGVKYFV